MAENLLVREHLHTMYELLNAGFYHEREVAEMIPILLEVLDGRGDVMGRHESESAAERYKIWRVRRCDTFRIMHI